MTTHSPFLPVRPVAIRFEPVEAWLETLPPVLKLEAVDGAITIYEERRGLMERLARRCGNRRLTVVDWACVGRFTYWFELAADTLVLVQIELDGLFPTDPAGGGLAAAIVVQDGSRTRIFNARAKPRKLSVRTHLPLAEPTRAHSRSRRAVDGSLTRAPVDVTAKHCAPVVDVLVNAHRHNSSLKSSFDVRRVLAADLLQWLVLEHRVTSTPEGPQLTRTRPGTPEVRAERLALRLALVVGATSSLPLHRQIPIIRAILMLGLERRSTRPSLSQQKCDRLIRALQSVLPSQRLRKVGPPVETSGALQSTDALAGLRSDLKLLLFAELGEVDNAIPETRMDMAGR